MEIKMTLIEETNNLRLKKEAAKRINETAVSDFVASGISKKDAEKVIVLIASGKIRIKIDY